MAAAAAVARLCDGAAAPRADLGRAAEVVAARSRRRYAALRDAAGLCFRTLLARAEAAAAAAAGQPVAVVVAAGLRRGAEAATAAVRTWLKVALLPVRGAADAGLEVGRIVASNHCSSTSH